MKDPLVAFAHRQRGSKKRFRKRLGDLGYRSYGEYLCSPHWQAKKRAFRRSKQVQSCRRCGNSRVQLHHLTYERIGNEHLEDLIPLCDDCHDLLHRLEDEAIVGLDGKEPPPVRADPPRHPYPDRSLEFWGRKRRNRKKRRGSRREPNPHPELKRKFGGYLAKQSARNKANRHPRRDGQVRPDPITASGGATASAKPVANPDGEAASQSKARRVDRRGTRAGPTTNEEKG